MFIFSSKSSCCSGTLTNIVFTMLVTKNNINKNTNYFQMCIFTISRSYHDNVLGVYVLSGHSVLSPPVPGKTINSIAKSAEQSQNSN